MRRRRGLFLVLEGPDGSGKSTQADLLVRALRRRGRRVVRTREPGGTPAGERIRAILLDPALRAITPATEALLYTASRLELADRVIRPALARGAVVVSERFTGSTLAYQGYGGGVPLPALRALFRAFLGGLSPDRAILLDVPAPRGLGRIRRRKDRMEARGGAFHARVRRGFLALAAADRRRWRVVDARGTPEAVHARVLAALGDLLP